MNRKNILNSQGFTLIEVMVAITLLVLVIIPLASFYAATLGTIQRSLLYSQSLQLCRERMELVEGIGYESIYYWNPLFTPGFGFGQGQWNQNRDPDTTDTNEVITYDPTDINDDGYPIPIYRDYYDNSTGLLIDPNYNGLCDDDLDGDGRFGVIDGDWDDIWIANADSNRDGVGDKWTDFASIDDLPQYMRDFANGDTNRLLKAGDGYYDTVVEGIYANAFDPAQYGTRQVLRDGPSTEQVSPIVDFSLQVNQAQNTNPNIAIPDYRHREQTFRTFARMTTIIDPTPELKDPNVQDPNLYHIVDRQYIERRLLDGYSLGDLNKIALCANRDLPLQYGVDNRSVGIDRQGFDNSEDYTQVLVNPYTQNYSQPIYGKKVIVTVFFLSGEGEQEDLNGDGFPDGENFASSNNVRMERMFYNNNLLGGSARSLVPPVPRFDEIFYNDSGHLRHIIEGNADETDPCSFENNGLPYLDDDWPGNV